MLTICTLDAQARDCKENCDRCGWNLKEQKRRQKLLETNGLEPIRKTKLKRLVIEREERE
jgi:hypothetical protein